MAESDTAGEAVVGPPGERPYYQLESGRVVRITGRMPSHYTLRDVETGQVWSVPKADFEGQMAAGYIQRVKPRWELAPE